MTELTNNTRVANAINLKLSQSNYSTWKPIVESYLRQQDLYYQIEYGDIIIYRATMPSSHTVKETRYWREKNEILVKPFVEAVAAVAEDLRNGVAGVAAVDFFGQEQQEDLLIVLETKYADCKSYENERGKEVKEWNKHHQKAFGILSSCVEEAIWQDVKCGKTIQLIWNQLKIATGQKTTTHWMSALKNVFTIQYNDNKTLTNLAA